MLKNSKTEKYYIALFDGVIKKEVRWENNIYQDKNLGKSHSADNKKQEKKILKKDAGKDIKAKKAVTIVKPIVFSDKNTLALVNIPTGRYHQIRKQGQINSHPLTGDRKYSGRQDIPFYFLHAFRLVLKEPSEITGFKSITAPLPEYFYKNAAELFSSRDINAFRDFIDKF